MPGDMLQEVRAEVFIQLSVQINKLPNAIYKEAPGRCNLRHTVSITAAHAPSPSEVPKNRESPGTRANTRSLWKAAAAIKHRPSRIGARNTKRTANTRPACSTTTRTTLPWREKTRVAVCAVGASTTPLPRAYP